MSISMRYWIQVCAMMVVTSCLLGGGCGGSSYYYYNVGPPTTTTTSTPLPTTSSGTLGTSTATPTPGAYGDLTLTGATITLTTGVYVFNNVNVTASSQIIIQGQVQMYVQGNGNIADSTIVQSGTAVASNFIMYGNDGKNLGFTNAGTIYGGIYAPNSTVSLSNTNVNGAVVASSFSATGSTVTYDSSLNTYTQGGLGMASMMSAERYNVKP